MKNPEEYCEILKNARLLNPAGDINLHTHTALCDGSDEPEDMVREAVRQGLRVLGFSGHGYACYDLDCCMTEENEEIYRREISRLRDVFRERIDIRTGIERDFFNDNRLYSYDYEIGSVHYVKIRGGLSSDFLSVDGSPETVRDGIDRFFGGSARKYVEAYYELEGDVIRETGADIVGHFDLVTKFNEGGRLFDESAGWYRRAAYKALRRILDSPCSIREGISDITGESSLPVFEINTGGMAKGYTDRPYPAEFLLREIAEAGCPVILSSDCHSKEKLRYGFSELLGH